MSSSNGTTITGGLEMKLADSLGLSHSGSTTDSRSSLTSHNLGPSLNRKDNMDIQNIVAQLRQEASRIERAIAALVGSGSQPPRRGRPLKRRQVVQVTEQKRRTMSASGRAKIAAAQRARWAKQKGTAAPKKAVPAQKRASGRKPMSPAMRKKLSAMMKARWAARKKAA